MVSLYWIIVILTESMVSLVKTLSTVHLSRDVTALSKVDVHHEQIQQLSPRVYGNGK